MYHCVISQHGDSQSFSLETSRENQQHWRNVTVAGGCQSVNPSWWSPRKCDSLEWNPLAFQTRQERGDSGMKRFQRKSPYARNSILP